MRCWPSGKDAKCRVGCGGICARGHVGATGSHPSRPALPWVRPGLHKSPETRGFEEDDRHAVHRRPVEAHRREGADDPLLRGDGADCGCRALGGQPAAVPARGSRTAGLHPPCARSRAGDRRDPRIDLAWPASGAPCADADRIATDHLAAVREKIAKLQRLEQELERIVSHCDGGHSIGECYVIRSLSDHGLCEHEH